MAVKQKIWIFGQDVQEKDSFLGNLSEKRKPRNESEQILQWNTKSL